MALHVLRRFLPLLACAGLFSACAAGSEAARRPEPELARAHPAFVQWLEQQSMLRAAPALTVIVSGSPLGWSASSTAANPTALLQQADIWLCLSPRRSALLKNPFPPGLPPHPAPTARAVPAAGSENMSSPGVDASALARMVRADLPARLAALGVRGLYVAEAAESGMEWNAWEAFPDGRSDAVSLNFAPAVGTDAEYAALEQAAARSGVLLGGDLLPPATGMGPDFLLAVRAVRDYPGLYMMLEVPPELWRLLPPLHEAPLSEQPDDAGNSSQEGLALSSTQAAALADAGLVPPAFARDGRPEAPGGWAATGRVTGVDGVTRRWLYRWAGSPRRPVLAWDDPSGTARRLFAASVIRQVGMLHQPLVGFTVEALWGQEPVAPNPPNTPLLSGLANTPSPEPGLSAMRALSRDTRRYGAWSLSRDVAPPAILPAIQAMGPDFARDTVTAPALEASVRAGDAALLNQALAASLKIGVDHARLWREAGPAFAATDGERPAGASTPTGEIIRAERLEAVRSLALVFRAMLPGLLVIHEDHLKEEELPRLAALRRATGVACGRLAGVAIMSHPAASGVLTQLPDGDYLLCAINVSEKALTVDARLPEDFLPRGGQDLLSGEAMTMDRDALRLRLPAFGWRIVRLTGITS